MPAQPNPRFHRALRASLAAILIAAALPLAAQTTAQTPALGAQKQPPPIPLSHLYRHFFLYEAHLEHLAQARPELAATGGNIKDHLRKKAGLSETEWQSVSASSLRMEASIQAQLAQQRALFESDRQLCISDPQACRPAPPSLPRLKELQKQGDAAIVAEMQALESTLGPDATSKLRAYLQGDLAGHVKIITISPAAIRAAHPPSPAAQANQGAQP